MRGSQSSSTFFFFLVPYTIYLAPVLIALYSHVYDSSHAIVLPFESPSLKSVVAYCLMVILYWLCNNWVLLAIGGTFRTGRSVAQKKEDILRLLMMHIPLLVFGRLHNRLESNPIAFVTVFFFYGAFYSFLYEKGKSLDIVITPTTLLSNPYAATVIGLTALVVVWNTSHHFFYLQDVLPFTALVLMLMFVLYLLPGGVFDNTGHHLSETHIHLHHWFWAYPCIFVCVLDTLPSFLSSIM